MSQPYSPQPGQPHPGQQPLGPPPQQPGATAYAPAPGKPPKRKRFGFLALGLAALAGLLLGGAVGGAGDDTTTTAAPAPTVTATTTVTADPPVVEGGSEPTEEPAPEPEPTTEEPAAYDPKAKDFKVSIKTTDKQCFGSAGCNVTYKVGLDYLGSTPLPSDGTTDITYEVSGAEDEIIGTLELKGDGTFSTSEEIASTSSSSKKLAAKITEVDYNEFG